jgi:hypothetical protein
MHLHTRAKPSILSFVIGVPARTVKPITHVITKPNFAFVRALVDWAFLLGEIK